MWLRVWKMHTMESIEIILLNVKMSILGLEGKEATFLAWVSTKQSWYSCQEDPCSLTIIGLILGNAIFSCHGQEFVSEWVLNGLVRVKGPSLSLLLWLAGLNILTRPGACGHS